ncbi:MAG: enoyl-CoA hydratase/isomerase family protein [Myxococcales bacterium]|nr:enoyl-CoA hydratase/isomerase family protein [Myxococcales bacterium]
MVGAIACSTGGGRAVSESFETLRVAREPQGIVVCTFHRPEVRNAMSKEMVDELRALLADIRGDSAVRVVIFTGVGKSFISGADIAELRDRDRIDALARINTALFREIETLPQPTIAAINGFALGGGCELALACDLRVAARGAKLGQPEVGLGIIPGAGGAYRLPRLVGLGRARELIFTGRVIDAAEAADIGLVERVVDDERLLDEARALAGAIAANSPLAVRLAKIVLNNGGEISSDAAMALESTAQAVLFEDDEKRRRMTAFLERRAARSKK